jgi:hypothetical protein
MKFTISLAGVRSMTPIPEIGVQVRELHVEIPEYGVNKVEITFICKIPNTSTYDLYTFVSCIMANTFCCLRPCHTIAYRTSVCQRMKNITHTPVYADIR